jgi:hypothetical protein
MYNNNNDDNLKMLVQIKCRTKQTKSEKSDTQSLCANLTNLLVICLMVKRQRPVERNHQITGQKEEKQNKHNTRWLSNKKKPTNKTASAKEQNKLALGRQYLSDSLWKRILLIFMNSICILRCNKPSRFVVASVCLSVCLAASIALDLAHLVHATFAFHHRSLIFYY